MSVVFDFTVRGVSYEILTKIYFFVENFKQKPGVDVDWSFLLKKVVFIKQKY